MDGDDRRRKQPPSSLAPKAGLLVMLLIIIVMLLLSVYSNVQRSRRADIEKADIERKAAASPSPAVAVP